MLLDKIKNTTIITQQKLSVIELVHKINSIYNKINKGNIIVSLVSLDKLKNKDISEFLQLSKIHRTAKHSFVLVSSNIVIDEAPEELVVVPTIQEAHDIIEMEEMERDLGI